jgi:hypothetical protein
VLNENARMACKVAEWKGVGMLKKRGAAGADDGNFFPQLEPNG